MPAGDVNGDGLPDLLIAPAHTLLRPIGAPAGTWRLLLGERSSTSWGYADEQIEIRAARLVNRLGDLNGDGFDELGVSYAAGTGVLKGRSVWPGTLDQTDLSLRLPRADDLGTVAFRALGDVNGDGMADLGHTDSGDATDGPSRGAVRVFLGPIDTSQEVLSEEDGAALLGRTWRNEEGDLHGFDALGQWSFLLGMGFASGSDLDGDGFDDFVVIGRHGNGLSGHLYLWKGRR